LLVCWFAVKTTVDLPPELVRAVKVRAATEGRRVKDVMAEALKRGLADQRGPGLAAPRRAKLPLVRCAHPATPETEMTPERVAMALLQEDARLLEQGTGQTQAAP
jgi:plasmid stability protein